MNTSFDRQLSVWAARASLFDKVLQPIVSEPIDINADGWEEQLVKREHPADRARMRADIEQFFDEIIDVFPTLDEEQRHAVIDLLGQKEHLMYSAVLKDERNTRDGFRRHLVLFILDDQGKDTRDAMLQLQCFYEEAQAIGIDAQAVFKDVSKLASTRDKYGWGSTRNLFDRYA